MDHSGDKGVISKNETIKYLKKDINLPNDVLKYINRYQSL
jgi:hypothetical protein